MIQKRAEPAEDYEWINNVYYRSYVLPWEPFDFSKEEDRYEAFAFAVKPRSRALGREPKAAAEIGRPIDLHGCPTFYGGNPTEHSAEFNFTIHSELIYWQRLLGFMGMAPEPIDVETATPTTYRQWSQLWFGEIGANMAPESSFANDGIANLAKYAFGLNPRLAGAESHLKLEFGQSISPSILLTFERRKQTSDIKFQVEMSTNLVSWNAIPASLTTTSTKGAIETVRANVSQPASSGSFFRISVKLLQ